MSRLAAVAALLLAVPLAAVDRDDTLARIYLANPDGSGMKPLVDLPEYKKQGSPCWSHDGKLIAFDASPTGTPTGDRSPDNRVIVVNADGTNPRVLGDGAMPSFSPKARRIAYSRSGQNPGVWVMSADGPEQESVLLDDQGWGAQWSPDGTRIVWAISDGRGRTENLVVFDLIEGTRELLFDKNAQYRAVYWNFAWSPDGRRIAFKGTRPNGKSELGIVDARGAKHGLVTRFEGSVSASFGWRPDGKQLLFSFAGPGSRTQLFAADPDAKDPPERLAGQDPDRFNSAAVYSPDGKTIALVSRKPPAKKADEKKDEKRGR
jgi:Tol biopolymer transport system component